MIGDEAETSIDSYTTSMESQRASLALDSKSMHYFHDDAVQYFQESNPFQKWVSS